MRKEFLLRYLNFGKTGLQVSQFALGTGMLGARGDRSIDPQEARLTLDKFVTAGGNLIDLSDAYQGGESETMVGTFISGSRENLILASKYSRTTSREPAPARAGNHRKAMVQAVESSLRRLNTTYIDVYFTHYDDGLTPMEEVMRGFDDLVGAGKILYAGLSNFSAWRTAEAAATAAARGSLPLSAVEIEYSLLQRTPEREILPMSRRFQLGVLGYSPLAAGVLTAKSASRSPTSGSRMGIPSEANVERTLASLIKIAAHIEADPAHVALAWVQSKGVIPILGARDSSQLAENLLAIDTQLEQQHIIELNQASAIPLGYPGALEERMRNA